jgi:ATP-dependent Clp protease adapter protein ClpS
VKLDPGLEKAIATAHRQASAVGHPKVTVYHLLAALLEDGAIQETIRQAGGSPERLKTVTAEHLQHVDAPSTWERFTSALTGRHDVVEASSFRRAFSVASDHIRTAGRSHVDVVDALVALFRLEDRELTGVLTVSGLSRLAILRYHCHGLPASIQSTAEVAPAARCEVVIFNDHYTEMALVVRILKKAFDMGANQAFRTMMRVHVEGSATAGPYSGDVAVTKLQLAAQMAAADDAPLRLELRAASG